MYVIIGAATVMFCILFAAVTYNYFRRRERQLLNQLGDMIEQARSGTLEVDEISEAKLSAIENSLRHYLAEKELDANYQQNNKEATRSLISDIAHQTVTPISNINIYTELLREKSGKDSSEIYIIQEQVEKLNFLIQSLLKLSRMEGGLITVSPRVTKVSWLLDGTGKEYAKCAYDKGVELTIWQTDQDAVFDLKWTKEALDNIIDNAIKYTPSGGRVKVNVNATMFFVVIGICDTGVGIDKAEQNDIFKRFYRSIKTSDAPGVGIGLYLAREIIEKQKGYIQVESEPGKGTDFKIFLPRQISQN